MVEFDWEQNYSSWEEFTTAALEQSETVNYAERKSFAECETVEELKRLCEFGWEDGGKQALSIADAVIQRVESEQVLVDTFQSFNSVSGGSVDVGLYLAGVPECMVEYEPVVISKAGKVIRLVISIGALANYSAEELIQRGAATVALALVLDKLQHSCEIWLDSTIEPGSSSNRAGLARTRVMIKHADDVVSPERLAFMLGHPAALRVLMFGIRCSYPFRIKRKFDIPGSMGASVNPVEDMEEGTIYTPALNLKNTGSKILKPYEFVVNELSKLGLINE